jgi:hypothetical protein
LTSELIVKDKTVRQVQWRVLVGRGLSGGDEDEGIGLMSF